MQKARLSRRNACPPSLLKLPQKLHPYKGGVVWVLSDLGYPQSLAELTQNEMQLSFGLVPCPSSTSHPENSLTQIPSPQH